MKLELPPLRKRKEDIPLLIEHFIQRLNRLNGKFVKSIDYQVLNSLMSYDFPGNIRELENFIEHAFILCSQSDIMLKHLLKILLNQHFVDSLSKDGVFQDTIKMFEVKVIIKALKRNNYNRKLSAEEFGINKNTLFRKIKKFGINLPKIDGRSRLN